MTPGDRLSLTIEKPAAGGWMIARSGGHVILVSGAIPGERATIEIDRVGKGVGYGRAVLVEEPSADRRQPFVDPACGGCLYAHIDYPRQLAIKSQVVADGLARIGHVDWPSAIAVAASPAEGYRMRSRLHIRGSKIGFFREGTHELCAARATRQLLPETCDVLDQLEQRLQSQPDIGGELEVSENVTASERVLHLDGGRPVAASRWGDLTAGLNVTGVSLTAQSERGAHAMVVAGDPHVTDVIALGGHDVRLRRHVQAFFQGNRFLLGGLVSHVLSYIDTGSDVVDLYAGAGLFAVPAAIVRGARVTAVEGDRFAAADLSSNAQGAGGGVKTIHQSVEAFTAHRHTGPSVLIVDPPRTGMSREALAGAIRLKARQVVYVSCDVATLARDARRFVDAGYEIEAIAAFDLFPNTPHVETVVVFQRSA